MRVCRVARSAVFAATFSGVSCILFAAAAEQAEVRQYPLQGHGVLKMNVPSSWGEEVRQPLQALPPTFSFRPKAGASFTVAVTPIWTEDTGSGYGTDPSQVKEQVQHCADMVASGSVEKQLKLVRMKGAAGEGYYFSATDSAPKPGEFKYLTQGILAAGEGLVLTFTVLTNDGQQEIVQKALAVLSGAVCRASEAGPAAAPADAAGPSPALAPARTTVPVMGEGWAIAFDCVKFKQQMGSRNGSGFVFRANADRYNLSIFVEPPAGQGGTHEDCYRWYWPQASRNPLIAKDTVSVSKTDRYSMAQYEIALPLDGAPFRQWHQNYYFAFQGRWVDVHLSVAEPTAADRKVLENFGKSLTYYAQPL